MHQIPQFAFFVLSLGSGGGIFLELWAAAAPRTGWHWGELRGKKQENTAKLLHTYGKASHGIFCHCTQLLYLLLYLLPKILKKKKC